jgi:hypothetical protein
MMRPATIFQALSLSFCVTTLPAFAQNLPVHGDHQPVGETGLIGAADSLECGARDRSGKEVSKVMIPLLRSEPGFRVVDQFVGHELKLGNKVITIEGFDSVVVFKSNENQGNPSRIIAHRNIVLGKDAMSFSHTVDGVFYKISCDAELREKRGYVARAISSQMTLSSHKNAWARLWTEVSNSDRGSLDKVCRSAEPIYSYFYQHSRMLLAIQESFKNTADAVDLKTYVETINMLAAMCQHNDQKFLKMDSEKRRQLVSRSMESIEKLNSFLEQTKP